MPAARKPSKSPKSHQTRPRVADMQGATTAALIQFAPDPEALTDRLHFNLAEGLIWLDDRRVLLLDAQWLADLRRELVQTFGAEYARGLFTRLGYAAGCRDAEMALRLHGARGAIRDVIFAGIQFHALQGTVGVVPLSYDVDVEQGRCHLEFEWRNSVEDQIHTEQGAPPGDSACWMEIGYSSGFLTTCMGKVIVVREVACLAAGATVCRCEARPAEAWDDVERDLGYLRPSLPPALPVAAPAASFTPTMLALPTLPATLARGTTSGETPARVVIGRSASFNAVLQRILRVAGTNATVLLMGESGVGKSAFAREIHAHSRRAGKPMLEVNCAAIPEALIEAELFGVERGAYTGAQATRAGRFEHAQGGTLFLDEIASLSLTAQSKLLRVLQSQAFERLGSSQTRQADVRIIAATNDDLEQAVKAGRFRLDLFFRLNVVPIHIPPLRERRDDVPLLLEHFVRRFCKLHFRTVPGFTARALRALLNHAWPGNIRELENVIERGVILADEGAPLDLPQLFTVDITFAQQGLLSLRGDGGLGDAQADPRPGADSAEDWALQLLARHPGGLFDVENALVAAALEETAGNVAKAARRLRITRAQLDYRIRKLAMRASV
jgi:two-component system, NtrC family, response regulator HydG